MTARYSIRAGAGATQVAIYDAIGSDGISAEAFLDQIGKITGPIALNICSVGGDVFQGLAIHDALRRRGQVTVRVDLAASIASIIALSGDRVLIGESGFFMLHDPHVSMTGTAEDLTKMAETLRKIRGTMLDCYRRRTGQSEATVSRWLSDETWFNSKQAIAARLADAVDDQPTRIANSIDLSIFRNPPAPLLALTAPAAGWDRLIAAKFLKAAG